MQRSQRMLALRGFGEIVENEFPHSEGQVGDTPPANPPLLVAGDRSTKASKPLRHNDRAV